MDNLLSSSGGQILYGPIDIITNFLVALILSILVALVYRSTHRSMSYSQSFVLTIIFVSIIVSIVMMVIGSSLARAFALVGALSIIRFRTVVKDTKDTSFIFIALAVGMAAGTSSYELALIGALGFSVVAIILDRIDFGVVHKSDFIIRFSFDQHIASNEYLSVFNRFCDKSNLLNITPTASKAVIDVAYDISLRDNSKSKEFISELSACDSLSNVTMIASKRDLDY